ncbi:hypothetical protein HanPSC8_Chr03g0132031 [Helianthus annuus]|nr:hypothetical protein HanPSC8_Chr03g0132031 [Helianthus annuus]
MRQPSNTNHRRFPSTRFLSCSHANYIHPVLALLLVLNPLIFFYHYYNYYYLVP